ncbi:hypothetical protein HOH45_04605, partial [bacterium]|nr:hypothetical protein [bacterium]
MNIFKIISLPDDDFGEGRDSLGDNYSGVFRGSHLGLYSSSVSGSVAARSVASSEWSIISANDKTFSIGSSNELKSMTASLYSDQQVCADIEARGDVSDFFAYMETLAKASETNLSILIDRLEQYVIFKYRSNEASDGQTATTISDSFQAVLVDDQISDPIKQAIIMYALKSTQQQ